MMHNFGDPWLHTHRYRLFTDRRSCWSRWWCIPSATTDYAMLYRLVIILAFHVSSSTSPLTSMFFKDDDDSQIRRQPTTYIQRSPLYRLAIILAFRLSSSTSPLTSNDLLFFKDGDDTQLWRSPTTYERRSSLYRLATTDYIHTEIAALSTGDYIGLPFVLIHIAPHFQWPSVLQGWRWYTTLAITNYVRTEIAASSFGDNRLPTHRDRRFIDWRLYWPSACPHPHRPTSQFSFIYLVFDEIGLCLLWIFLLCCPNQSS